MKQDYILLFCYLLSPVVYLGVGILRWELEVLDPARSREAGWDQPPI